MEKTQTRKKALSKRQSRLNRLVTSVGLEPLEPFALLVRCGFDCRKCDRRKRPEVWRYHYSLSFCSLRCLEMFARQVELGLVRL